MVRLQLFAELDYMVNQCLSLSEHENGSNLVENIVVCICVMIPYLRCISPNRTAFCIEFRVVLHKCAEKGTFGWRVDRKHWFSCVLESGKELMLLLAVQSW